jgi:hypothetical protein
MLTPEVLEDQARARIDDEPAKAQVWALLAIASALERLTEAVQQMNDR